MRVENNTCQVGLCEFIKLTFNYLDSSPYLHNWHIDLISRKLLDVYEGKTRRLLINIPPRNLKSICVNVAWTAWLLGVDPRTKIISISYSQALSTKHSTDCRAILESDWYRSIFPNTKIAHDQNQKMKFMTTKRGFRFASSIGGTLLGEGADFIIVDDPQTPLQASSAKQCKKVEEWFSESLSTRLNNKKKGAIVVVMQRLHPEDLSGSLMHNDDWDKVILPAIAQDDLVFFEACNKFYKKGDILHPEREGEEELESMKKSLGSFNFAAQYQQNPIDEDGGMVKLEWFKRY